MSNTEQPKQEKPVVWRFLSSMKLTIALLILLAILSVLGTFVPLETFNMYHSVGFRFLIGCLALNLIICSIDQFPRTWKRIRTIPSPDRSKPFKNLPAEQTFTMQITPAQAADRINHLLTKRYHKTSTKTEPGKHFFYVEKGRLSHFGVYLVHASVLLILTGSLIGSFFGFEAFVNILEGEQTDSVSMTDQHARMALGFEVRCDKFTREFYENGMIKEYRSDLTFLINEKEVEKKSVIVNHPVQFMGINFYQSSYGVVSGRNARIRLLNEKNNKTHTFDIEAGKPIKLPNGEGRISIVDAKANFMNTGPAVLISITFETGDSKEFWIFKNYDKIRTVLPGQMLLSSKFDPTAVKPYTFVLDTLELISYTGLQVTRDPGVPVVWAGFFIMVAGFLATFFMSHKRIWVRAEEENEGLKISVAGNSNKNQIDLNKEIDKLLTHLKTRLENKRASI